MILPETENSSETFRHGMDGVNEIMHIYVPALRLSQKSARTDDNQNSATVNQVIVDSVHIH